MLTSVVVNRRELVRPVWKSTHVLQLAKQLNNSAVSKPRAEGERRKILDLFFDAKTIQNPSERVASEEKYHQKNMARAARREKIQTCSFQKFKTPNVQEFFKTLISTLPSTHWPTRRIQCQSIPTHATWPLRGYVLSFFWSTRVITRYSAILI